MSQLATAAPVDDGDVDLLGDLTGDGDSVPTAREELTICTSDGG